MKAADGENGDLLVTVSNVKDWLITKSKDATGLLPTMKDTLRSSLTFAQVVVTPDNIPAFTIPGEGAGLSPRLSIESQEIELLTRSRGSLSTSETSSPRLSPCQSRETSPCLLVPKQNFMSRSAPVSPHKSGEKHAGTWDHEASDVQAATNADPYSLTAMSLPHLKAVTTFGFETLSECPNTRRKESLFHDGELSPGQEPLTIRLQRRRVNSAETAKSPIAEDGENRLPQRKLSARGSAPPVLAESECRLSRKQSSKRRNVASVVAPLGVVLPQQRRSIGETGNPLLLTTPSPNSRCSSPVFFGDKFAAASKRWDFVNNKESVTSCRRRRSGSLGRDDLRYAVSQSNELSAPSPTGGQILFRRNSCSPNLMDESPTGPQPHCPSPPTNNSPGKRASPQSPSSWQTGTLADLGELHFTFHHDSTSSQFCVSLHRAVNLLCTRPGQELNPYAKLCLMPGKMQKQSSLVCRHTANPEFNQDLIFKDVSLKQLSGMKLRIRMYSKNQNLRRPDFLGEVLVILEEYTLTSETCLWLALEPRMSCEELGRLQISLCFHPSMEKLDVRVIQAKDLPKTYLAGLPDPYVKLELLQPNRTEVRRQTRIKKKCQSPAFNEDFLLDISPKIQDLNLTVLSLTVYGHELIRSDEMIGQVRLGYGATEVLEFDHWNNVLQNPGKEYTFWHVIMEAD